MVIVTNGYYESGGYEYYHFPLKYITDENALKEAIQKDKEDKEEKERKRIAEEEAKRLKEIENEKKKQDEEYQQYLKLKEKFKDVD